jgi:hypothetical protein
VLWQHFWSAYQPEGDSAKASTGAIPDLAPDVQAKMGKMQEAIRALQSQRDRAAHQVEQGKTKGKGRGHWLRLQA